MFARQRPRDDFVAHTASSANAEDAHLFRAFTITSTGWLLLTTAVGLLLSFKFPYPDWATSPLLSFGRLRAIHTNGTFYGWATIVLVGAALYVAARTSGIAIAGKRLAWLALLCFNLAAIVGTVTLGSRHQLRRPRIPRMDLAG